MPHGDTGQGATQREDPSVLLQVRSRRRTRLRHRRTKTTWRLTGEFTAGARLTLTSNHVFRGAESIKPNIYFSHANKCPGLEVSIQGGVQVCELQLKLRTNFASALRHFTKQNLGFLENSTQFKKCVKLNLRKLSKRYHCHCCVSAKSLFHIFITIKNEVCRSKFIKVIVPLIIMFSHRSAVSARAL